MIPTMGNEIKPFLHKDIRMAQVAWNLEETLTRWLESHPEEVRLPGVVAASKASEVKDIMDDAVNAICYTSDLELAKRLVHRAFISLVTLHDILDWKGEKSGTQAGDNHGIVRGKGESG